MGGFDWSGTSRGLGALGESVVGAVEERRAERKLQEAKEEEERKRRKALRVQAAEVRLRALQANRVPYTDPQYQAALSEYQAALADYLEQPGFRLPSRPEPTAGAAQPPSKSELLTPVAQPPATSGPPIPAAQPAKPAETTPTPPPPAKPVMLAAAAPSRREVILPLEPTEEPQQEMTWGEFADSIGLQMTPEQRRLYGGRPWKEVMALNAASRQLGRPLFPALTQDDEQLVERTHNEISNYIRLIAAATTPTERAAAVDAARRWKQSVLEKYPQLAKLFPDFAGLGIRFDREARQAAESKAAAARYDTWRAALQRAYQRYREAFRGIDPYELAAAIDEYNRLVDLGVKAGYYEKGVGQRLPSFEQIRPTWLKARERDIMRANLDLATKQAQLARLRRELAEGPEAGQSRTEERRLGTYVIRDYYDRRGNLTKQVVTDARTGKVITNEMLERRAAQGDQAAAALLGYTPRPTEPAALERQLGAIRQLSDEDLNRAEDALDQELLNPKGLSPARLAEIRRLKQEIRAERVRRFRSPGIGARKGATAQEQQIRLEANPPSPEAAMALRIWRQTRKPIPRGLWNRLGALNPANQAWLRALGVEHE